MLVTKSTTGYTSLRQYVQGKGFVDSLKSIGSYVARNKDLIAKPLLGAVGNLAATGLEEGGKALLTHIMKNKRNSQVNNVDPQLDVKGKEILKSIINSGIPVTNIIGSGACSGYIGSGIKKF